MNIITINWMVCAWDDIKMQLIDLSNILNSKLNYNQIDLISVKNDDPLNNGNPNNGK